MGGALVCWGWWEILSTGKFLSDQEILTPELRNSGLIGQAEKETSKFLSREIICWKPCKRLILVADGTVYRNQVESINSLGDVCHK